MTQFRMTRIEPPGWARQPDLTIMSVTVAQYASIQRHRDELLRVVHLEVESFLNTPGLYGEGESFPDRHLLTGAYYIGDEAYKADEASAFIEISIQCRCLERPRPGFNREDDYLGLEVWLRCLAPRWDQFEIFRYTDSSSI